jgi:hypothetical protein
MHPFVADRPKSGMFCKIYYDLRKYLDKFLSYLRLSIGSLDELLTICENDMTKQDTILRKSHKHSGSQWTGLKLSCDVDLAFVAAMPIALALGILVGRDAKFEARRMPGAIYDYKINTFSLAEMLAAAPWPLVGILVRYRPYYKFTGAETT